MQSKTLGIKDFTDLEDFIKKLAGDIYSKEVRKEDTSKEVVEAFQKLYLTLDESLTRAGRKPIMAI
jgi:hypothetical protein